MGATKDSNYSTEDLLLAQIASAIGHPARAKMLRYLMQKGSFRNTDFSRENNFSVSVSHFHIYKLKHADLVNLEYANSEYYVTLKPDNIEIMKQLLALDH